MTKMTQIGGDTNEICYVCIKQRHISQTCVIRGLQSDAPKDSTELYTDSLDKMSYAALSFAPCIGRLRQQPKLYKTPTVPQQFEDESSTPCPPLSCSNTGIFQFVCVSSSPCKSHSNSSLERINWLTPVSVDNRCPCHTRLNSGPTAAANFIQQAHNSLSTPFYTAPPLVNLRTTSSSDLRLDTGEIRANKEI